MKEFVKRKMYYCTYNDDWCKYKNWLCKVDEFMVECILCHQIFSTKHEGRRPISIHVECMKHKDSEKSETNTFNYVLFYTKGHTLGKSSDHSRNRRTLPWCDSSVKLGHVYAAG